MSRMDRVKQTFMTSNSNYLSSLPGIKELHDETEDNMLKDQVTFKTFAKVGRLFRTKLSTLEVKVKEQEIKLESLLNDVREQLALMKRVEVDISLKLRACAGSCQKFHVHDVNMDEYRIWKKRLEEMNKMTMIQTQNISHLNLYLVQNKVTNHTEPSSSLKGMQLDRLESIEQYVLKLEEDYSTNQTNNVLKFTQV